MDSEGVRTDPQLQQFIETESQKQRFQQLVHQMTEVCWIDLHESVSAILTFLKNKARSKRIPQLPYDVQMCTEQPTNHCSSIQISNGKSAPINLVQSLTPGQKCVL